MVRFRPTSRTIACVVCALLVSSLVISGFVVPIVANQNADLVSSDDDLEIDDSLRDLEDSETVELVVRFEEATVPEDASDDEVEYRLEEHAAKTQAPLLDYATETAWISVEEEFWVTNAVLLEVETDRVDLEAFERFDAIEAIHENFELSVPPEPDERDDVADEDDDPSATWGVEAVNAPTVWEEHDARGDGVRVAVLDTGVDADHPDIELHTDDPTDPTYPGGWAEFNESGDRVVGSTPYDSGAHGTHVSATVAGGNQSGTAIGVAPEAELLHGLVLDEEGGTFAQIIAGMEWALEEEADVISMSFGATGRHHQLTDPVRNAEESGVAVVAAIGNEGEDTSGSPANVYNSISVGAVGPDGTVASFSGGERLERTEWETGPETYVAPDVVAPGVAIDSAVPGGGYEPFPGTSMATPHVAGTIALLLEIEPDTTPSDVSRILTETAWKPADAPDEKDTRYGYGIVDADAAATQLVDERVEPEEVASTQASDDHSTDDVEAESWLESMSTSPIGEVIVLTVAAVLLGLFVVVARNIDT
ncbi:S8 family serine peptidase [Natrialba swarupiae]|uniref:S8 family serine peptidase n=1 Tax=Natrialba swarupiae TaxID=2448032 RepID=A0A5D5ART5_9EURY|nr:S8 family serine peptidase [Natrialba swarupiae]